MKRIAKNIKSSNFSVFFTFLYSISIVALFLLVVPILWIIFSENPITLFETLKSVKVQMAIATTFLSSTITALVSLIFGVALGYLLSRKSFRSKSFIVALIGLPLALPHSVAGIALLSVFGRTGLIGQLFPTEYGSVFTRSLLGIVIAQLFVSAPIVIQNAKETFDLIDVELEQFSRILGAGTFTTFRKIIFPIAKSSLFAGGLLSWARASSEFGAVVFLAYYPLTAPVLVFDIFNSQGYNAVRPVAVILVILSTIIFLLVNWLSKPKIKRE